MFVHLETYSAENIEEPVLDSYESRKNNFSKNPEDIGTDLFFNGPFLPFENIGDRLSVVETPGNFT